MCLSRYNEDKCSFIFSAAGPPELQEGLVDQTVPRWAGEWNCTGRFKEAGLGNGTFHTHGALCPTRVKSCITLETSELLRFVQSWSLASI